MDRRGFVVGMSACVASIGAGVLLGGPDPAWAWPWEAGKPTTTSRLRDLAQPDALFAVRTKAPLVGLSFDDGPDPMYTPHVLDLLDRFEASATFFAIGVNAEAHPALVARCRAGGHGVGNHTLHHADLEQLGPVEVVREIEGGAQAIIAAGGVRPRYFRPPKGLTDRAVGVVADARRYRTVFWTECLERRVDHARSVADGVDDLLRRVRPGSIVLAHDGGHVEAPGHPVVNRTKSMEALPRLLEGLHARGLRAVDIATLERSARRPPAAAAGP